MRRRLQRGLTGLLTGLALVTGLLTVATVPAQAATFTVSVTASATTVTVGGRVTFSGVVSPKPKSRTLHLQQRYVGSKRWVRVKKFSAASTGRYSVAASFGNDRDRYYRVYKPKAGKRKAGYSRTVKVVVNPAAKIKTAPLTSIAPGTVPLSGGQAVIVSGPNLAGATRVTVTPKVAASDTRDGTGSLPALPATFKVIDAQTLRVTSPASLGGANQVRVYTPTTTFTGTLTYARTSRQPSQFEREVLDQVNLRRAKAQKCNGRSTPAVGPVAWDGELSDLALSHASDLATRQSVYRGLNHVTYGLKEFSDRFHAAGFTTGSLGEDLALSPKRYTPSDVVDQWIASKTGHCESVMRKNWAHAGVGVAHGDWGGQASIFTNLNLRS